MPAKVIFKSGFPSIARPVETSTSIGADGLITGSAVFLIAPAPSSALISTVGFSIGAPISPALFSGLRDVLLQGLFIETRNLEKREGLTYLRLGVVGAVNPPIVERRREVSPRGFSKSAEIDGRNVIFSFSYQAETLTASTVLATGQAFGLTLPEPRSINEWNFVGGGSFTANRGLADTFSGPSVAGRAGGVSVSPRILTSESSEDRVGITRITKTAQFIYE